MNKIALIISLVFISFTANAGYWRCIGKNMDVSFIGLGSKTLIASVAHSEEVSPYQATVNIKDVDFNETGKALKDVDSVSGKDVWGNLLVLDIEHKTFKLFDSDGIKVKSDKKMKCDYSEGE